MVLIIILMALSSCSCMSQIPTQFYYVNDSCEFYLPDYTQAVQARDNCCLEQITQDPPSGKMLAPGEDILVTITAMDCYGNTSSMTFDVVTIDTIPPTFHYDSTMFIPTGMYQNEERTFLLYTVIDTFPEADKGIMMTHYYRDSTWPVPQESSMDTSGLRINHFKAPDYFKRQFFTARSSYQIDNIRLPMIKEGDPGDVIVELWEVDSTDNLVRFVSLGGYDGSQLWDDGVLRYHIFPMSEAQVQQGVKYAIQVHLTAADSENYVSWFTNDASKTDYYLMYTYDNMETWGYNHEGNYMFEIWGVKTNGILTAGM